MTRKSSRRCIKVRLPQAGWDAIRDAPGRSNADRIRRLVQARMPLVQQPQGLVPNMAARPLRVQLPKALRQTLQAYALSHGLSVEEGLLEVLLCSRL